MWLCMPYLVTEARDLQTIKGGYLPRWMKRNAKRRYRKMVNGHRLNIIDRRGAREAALANADVCDASISETACKAKDAERECADILLFASMQYLGFQLPVIYLEVYD